MHFFLRDIQKAHAHALFSVGDEVTIQLYDRLGADVTPASPKNECIPRGSKGAFIWPYANLDSFPSDYEEYLWTMTNQSAIDRIDVDAFSPEDARSFFLIPFDVDVSSLPINKGDSWEPEIRVDTNSTNLNVAVEFTDKETTINKKTSDLEGGGDDQVLLVAQGDTFQIFRIFLSGDETELFQSRFVDMKITAETRDGKTQTIKKKIPFTQTPAISFDTVT